MALNRPPSDITPKEFFESWLPGEYQRLRDEAGGPTPPDATVELSLAGDGGGTWTVTVRDGALAAKPQAAGGQAQAAVSQTVQDWRALIAGEEGAPKLVPDHASPMDLLLLDPKKAQALENVKGTLRFEVSEFNGRTWGLEATINGGTEPKSTITVDADTYQQMAAGTLPPPQAYFAGKIQIGGDANFAMQLAMQLMANMNQ